MIFAACFTLRGRDTHKDFVLCFFLYGQDLSSDASAFSLNSFETQSSLLRLNKGFPFFNVLQIAF